MIQGLSKCGLIETANAFSTQQYNIDAAKRGM
jgi:hypothetical protein